MCCNQCLWAGRLAALTTGAEFPIAIVGPHESGCDVQCCRNQSVFAADLEGMWASRARVAITRAQAGLSDVTCGVFNSARPLQRSRHKFLPAPNQVLLRGGVLMPSLWQPQCVETTADIRLRPVSLIRGGFYPGPPLWGGKKNLLGQALNTPGTRHAVSRRPLLIRQDTIAGAGPKGADNDPELLVERTRDGASADPYSTSDMPAIMRVGQFLFGRGLGTAFGVARQPNLLLRW